MSIRIPIIAVALTVALGSVPAQAQSEADEDTLRRAVTLFEASEELYNQGDFAQATDLLRRAHALHANPTLLFNLARALEGLGELDEAIETYDRYLAEADDISDRGAIERRLETLREQRDQLAARAEEPEPEEADEPDPPAEMQEEAPGTAGDTIEPAPWIVLGVGVATIGAGAVVGVLSQDAATAAQAEPVQELAVAQHQDAEALAIAANVLFAVGGAAALAGAIWGIVTLLEGEQGEHVEAAVGPSSVRVRGRF